MDRKITKYVLEALSVLYSNKADIKSEVHVEKTKKGIDGDFTVVVFPLVKYSKKSPQDTAQEIGVFIKSRYKEIASYNVIKGFLNLTMSSECWIDALNKLNTEELNKANSPKDKTFMIEFSSPNTNKPLHLGHIRNNLLGDSISKILKANGYDIIKANLINDRGIHICKTIYAWIKWGKGATPESEKIKGDKLVGNFYVLFENKYKAQVEKLIKSGMDKHEAENSASLIIETREILKKWEANDPEIIEIWKMMNEWVYKGFNETYKNIGIEFDKYYYESETYLLGKDIVKRGLEDNIFYKEKDNSVWIDLEKEEFEKKLLLRDDGTTVYMTQDLGTAFQRFDDYELDKIIYVVGNEQNYHFKLLKEIIAKFDKNMAKKIKHLSYGMVELPEGKMKSREGKVVDADDLINEMLVTARKIAKEQGKIHELSKQEREKIIRIIAMGALKYFILKIDPKKNMIFNPAESIDFNGNTGPFIQYTYARIKSVLRNAEKMKIKFTGKISEDTKIVDKEINLISQLISYKTTVENASETLDPGIITNYLYDLVKEYNQFYHDYNILKEKSFNILQFRLILSQQVAEIIQAGMNLLGIEVPEIM